MTSFRRRDTTLSLQNSAGNSPNSDTPLGDRGWKEDNSLTGGRRNFGSKTTVGFLTHGFNSGVPVSSHSSLCPAITKASPRSGYLNQGLLVTTRCMRRVRYWVLRPQASSILGPARLCYTLNGAHDWWESFCLFWRLLVLCRRGHFHCNWNVSLTAHCNPFPFPLDAQIEWE